MTSSLLPGFEPEEVNKVRAMSVPQLVERAIALLRANEPPDGYCLAFSGGKDSCAIKSLAAMSGVRFEAWYNATTIDPPELVRFLREHHQDVQWNRPPMPMMKMVAEAPKVPPTRVGRWCCERYKEYGGRGRVRIFGVRAAESPKRAGRWREVSAGTDLGTVICPIVYWSDDQVWEFIRWFRVPYCSLYDEGFTRLGCVGCPLASKQNIEREFARWPRFEANWRRAIEANWLKWKDVPNTKTGRPRFHAKFATPEAFWRWWRYPQYQRDVMRDDCQSGVLWTSESDDGLDGGATGAKAASEAVGEPAEMPGR
jgi:phosphoadenosine phosphosulfate reductase